MKKDCSTGDLERIQRGLEEFLQQEMREDWDSRDKEHEPRTKKTKKKANRETNRKANKKTNKKSDKKSKTKKPKKKSRFKRFLLVLLLLFILLAAGVFYVIGTVYDKMHYEETESVEVAPLAQEGVINVLLIGNDSRTNGGDGRSDAMILLTINSGTKKIYMTSLLRDMYVEIPGYKNNRLNAAYSFGGAELLMETIEHNFDITVNRYVLVNFQAFADLVDAVGGIELELSSSEIEYVNAYLWEYNVLTEKPEGTDYMDTTLDGVVHLNGPQALAYTRIRYLGTDFGRTERQRKVLSAIINRMPMAMLTNATELIEGIMPNLTTNLTKGECYQLFLPCVRALSYEMVPYSIPLEGTYRNANIRGMDVLEVDFEANKQFLQENIFGEKE